jgi:hypothetical protein
LRVSQAGHDFQQFGHVFHSHEPFQKIATIKKGGKSALLKYHLLLKLKLDSNTYVRIIIHFIVTRT